MFEIDGYHIVLAVIGAGILLAHWLPRLVSGREPAASALLIVAGYLAFAFIPGAPSAISPIKSPGTWGKISEICLIVGLFGVGIRIDKLKNWTTWQPTARLLVLALPLTVFAVALTGWLAGMTVGGALLLGAVLAPTDPVLASDVQVGPPSEGGEHPVRFALTTEAGLNDGLAFPFVHLAIAVAAASTLSADLIGEWVLRDVIYRVIAGVAGGAAMGWLLAKFLFDWPAKNPLSKTETGLVALAGVLIIYGVTELVEGYGFIAVFVAGLTLRRSETSHDYHTKLHDFVEAIERAITAVILLALGAALPAILSELDWSGVIIAILLVLVIRPVMAWLSLAGTHLDTRGRNIVSFYGIRGVGSIYYLAYVGVHIEMTDIERLWAIVAFTIMLSTVVHGFTAGIAVSRAIDEKVEQES